MFSTINKFENEKNRTIKNAIILNIMYNIQGRIQDFKLGVGGGGAHLKKMHRAEGGAKIVGVFRVKNHDFTPKNHIFSNFRGGARRVRPPPPPLLDPPLIYLFVKLNYFRRNRHDIAEILLKVALKTTKQTNIF